MLFLWCLPISPLPVLPFPSSPPFYSYFAPLSFCPFVTLPLPVSPLPVSPHCLFVPFPFRHIVISPLPVSPLPTSPLPVSPPSHFFHSQNLTNVAMTRDHLVPVDRESNPRPQRRQVLMFNSNEILKPILVCNLAKISQFCILRHCKTCYIWASK
jgi:hypothetical protein